MKQSPVDDDMVVFIGMYQIQLITNYFRNQWNKLGIRRLWGQHSCTKCWKEDRRVHVSSHAEVMGASRQLDELR